MERGEQGWAKSRNSKGEKDAIFATPSFIILTGRHHISPFSQLGNMPEEWVLEDFYKLLLKLAFVDLLC